MTKSWTDAETAWLREHYDDGDSVNDVMAAFVEQFGPTHTRLALNQKAAKLGLRRHDRCHADERNRPAPVRMRWTDPRNADKLAWMLEHDNDESVYTVIDAFEREFGIRLNRNQVTCFRQLHGQLKRRDRGGGREPKPLGAELERKDGYIYVKVREKPERPGTRDNWEPKHHVVYRQHHGEIPEGCCVYFADRDTRNFDPDNLVAVPRRYIAVLNNADLPIGYHDAESLKACMAWIDLHHGIREAESSRPRTCEVCGAEFTEDERMRINPTRAKTCRACLDAGKRARGKRRAKHVRSRQCAVCGATFAPEQGRQRRCPECIAKAPKRSAENQRRSK